LGVAVYGDSFKSVSLPEVVKAPKTKAIVVAVSPESVKSSSDMTTAIAVSDDTDESSDDEDNLPTATIDGVMTQEKRPKYANKKGIKHVYFI
jgi:hypothetical protein